MGKLPAVLAAAVLALAAASALADDVTVSDATVRATAPGQDTASAGLTIRSEKDGKLVAASTPVAKRVELHVMKHENGMMMMRPVASILLPAGKEVVLGSEIHLMLVGLKRPLKAGEKIELTLTVRYAGMRKEKIKVTAEVKPVAADAPDGSGKGGMGGMDMGGSSMGGHDY